MKIFRKYTLYLVLSIVGISIGFAGIPFNPYNYQGEVIYNGSPANGDFEVTFTIYGALVGGSSWATIDQALTIENGLINTEFDFFDVHVFLDELWLEISIKDPGTLDVHVLEPRIAIGSSPYAINAYRAQTVEDDGITSSSIVNGTITRADLAVDANIWRESSVGIYTTKNVGIGAIVPIELLHLNGEPTDEIRLDGFNGSPLIHFRQTSNGSDWILKQDAATSNFYFQRELVAGHEVLTLSSTGNVGIGTASPSGILDVRNSSDEAVLNVHSDGRIDRKLQTRTLIVGYKSFVPVSNVYDYSTLNFLGMNGIISNYTGGGPAKFQANVRLPENAVVTQFEAITGDNSPSGAAVVKFGYQAFSSNNAILTLSTLTSSNIPFGEIISATINTTILADRMYFIDVDLDRITTGGQNVLFAGVRITYTIDEL